ncbi:MAG: hypothetical protein Q8936_14240 [Bacillota bacterium]|nr:hypothetical protein [Bacillota bacterium]
MARPPSYVTKKEFVQHKKEVLKMVKEIKQSVVRIFESIAKPIPKRSGRRKK